MVTSALRIDHSLDSNAAQVIQVCAFIDRFVPRLCKSILHTSNLNTHANLDYSQVVLCLTELKIIRRNEHQKHGMSGHLNQPHKVTVEESGVASV